MSKSSFILILSIFLAGLALGYMDFLSLPEKEISSGASSTSLIRRPSWFKQMHYIGGKTLPLPSKSNVGSLFPKYARLTPQETKEELLRLLKASHEGTNNNTSLFTYDAIKYLACKLGAQSPEEAKRLLEDKNSLEVSYLYSALLQGWASRDFDGAMSYLLAHKKDNTDAQNTFIQLTRTLVRTDPSKAIQWAATLKKGERTTALWTMAEELPKQHPEQAPQFIAVLTPDDMSSTQMEYSLSQSWAKSDWDSFKTWINTLPEKDKTNIFKEGIGNLSEVNLDKATEEFKIYEGKDKYDVAYSIVSGICHLEQQNEKAIDWILENIPDTTQACRLVDGTIDIKADVTPEVTRKILQIPEGKVKDSALKKVAETLSWPGRDPRMSTPPPPGTAFLKAMDMANKIGDRDTRNRTTHKCLSNWITKYPEDARQWIVEKSLFTEQEKKKFIQDCNAAIPKEIDLF